MLLEIITPEKSVFKGKVKMVQVPGTKSPFQMLHNHAPIISSLEKGKVRIVKNNGKEEFFEVTSGVIENHNNDIKILVEQ
ncbi:MAG: ATP synthase F1 subunit epsilon [Candidatus Delongbacteria bacterium]|jgi:F-type H+-transporting ATPase subunit epsilon|nr:ATP synthase F1 subunit epsilon [Candidatus Delongbacteria bacterium]